MLAHLLTQLRRNFAFKPFIEQVDYHYRCCTRSPDINQSHFHFWLWSFIAINAIFGWGRQLLAAISPTFFEVDIQARFLFIRHADWRFICCIALLFMGNSLHTYLIFQHSLPPVMWTMFHENIVQNWRLFWSKNGRLKLREAQFGLHWDTNLVRLGLDSRRLMQRIWTQGRGVKLNYRLAHYPYLPGKIRAKAICVSIIVMAIQAGSSLMYCKCRLQQFQKVNS